MGAGLGLEPKAPEHETGMLPLHHPAKKPICGIEPQKQGRPAATCYRQIGSKRSLKRCFKKPFGNLDVMFAQIIIELHLEIHHTAEPPFILFAIRGYRKQLHLQFIHTRTEGSHFIRWSKDDFNFWDYPLPCCKQTRRDMVGGHFSRYRQGRACNGWPSQLRAG